MAVFSLGRMGSAVSEKESDVSIDPLQMDWPRKAVGVHDELLADGSMVLYHVATNQLLTLNPTAAIVWEYCDGLHTLPAIVAAICDLFPGVPTVLHDVAAILGDLRTHGMLDSDGR